MHEGVAWATRRKRRGRRHGGELAADDRLDEIRLGGGARIDRRRDLAIPQNRRAIGDLHHLVDIVRNEDDACAFGDDGAHQLEQAVDVALWQKRRRLVQHQKAWPHAGFLVHFRNCADDREQRALDRRDVCDAHLGIEIDVVAQEQPLRGAALRQSS